MATSHSAEAVRDDSPDPSSHAENIYDVAGPEGEWLDEIDDDDDMFEPATDESEDAEFFDPSEDVEAGFHGKLPDRCPHLERLLEVLLSGDCLLMFNGLVADAEDGMSGVESEFSVEHGDNTTQADRATGTEAGVPDTEASTTTDEPLRRQGKWHHDFNKQNAKFYLQFRL